MFYLQICSITQEIAKKCNARKFFFVVCDEDDAFFKIDQAITVRMATCDRGITKGLKFLYFLYFIFRN